MDATSRKTGKNSFDITGEIVASLLQGNGIKQNEPEALEQSKQIAAFYEDLLRHILKIKIDYENKKM
jgi:hypothetical protein